MISAPSDPMDAGTLDLEAEAAHPIMPRDYRVGTSDLAQFCDLQQVDPSDVTLLGHVEALGVQSNWSSCQVLHGQGSFTPSIQPTLEMATQAVAESVHQSAASDA